jgi:hypothetical protein
MMVSGFARLPTKTLNRAAVVAMLAGVFALGIGIGWGCSSLMIAAEVVILAAGLVPAVVDCCDAKRRPEPPARKVSVWSRPNAYLFLVVVDSS